MRTLLNKWVLIIGALVLVVAAVLVGRGLLGAQTARAAVQTGTVTRGDIQATVLSSGALQPAADLTLTFGSAGTVATINVKPGDRVEKGQTIAALDATDLNLAVVQAEANLNSAKAKLDSLKAGPAAKDTASAQSSLQSAQAKLAGLKVGPTAPDLASAQAALDSAKAKPASVKA